MNAKEYQKAALRTATGMTRRELILNCALGIAGETGEVTEIMYTQGYNKDKVCEELGDCTWYVAVILDAIDKKMEDIAPKKIERAQTEMAIINLALQGGRIADIVKKSMFHKHELGVDMLTECLQGYLQAVGNVGWIYGLTLRKIYKVNIEKLLERYPEGFSAERSINRGKPKSESEVESVRRRLRVVCQLGYPIKLDQGDIQTILGALAEE